MCEYCGLDTIRLLREHILAEQNGVSPAAISHLSSADWGAIERIRERVGTAVPIPVR